MAGNETKLSDVTFMLDRLLFAARGCESALSLALCADDAVAIRLAADKLEKMIAASYAAVDSMYSVDHICRSMLSIMLEQAMEVAFKLLARSWKYFTDGRTILHEEVHFLDQPTLVGLNGSGRVLRDIGLQNLHLICCQLSSDLWGASFLQIKLSECDFAYGGLAETLWQEVRAELSSFRECDFSGAQLGDVVFIDCDFHGAKVSHPCDDRSVNRTNARFIRCNLTSVEWGCTPSAGIHFLNCQGLRGRPESQPLTS